MSKELDAFRRIVCHLLPCELEERGDDISTVEVGLQIPRNLEKELERLQQKETPMKVIHLLPHQCQVVVKCPKCKCMMGVDDRSSYCSSCGQHLDWSDEK